MYAYIIDNKEFDVNQCFSHHHLGTLLEVFFFWG